MFTSTKLFVPVPEFGLVERRRVLDLLDAGASARLVLVSAPAGSDKSTLVADWVHRSDLPTSWLSLDSGDDEPQTFARCLVEAFHALGPDVAPRTRALLDSGSPPEPRMVVLSLVAELVQFETGGVLVLDDLHLLRDESVLALLALLLDRAPPGVRIVVITRSDPPLPLARLRARGQLHEVRQADLRFEPDEAAEMVRRLSLKDLRPESWAALTERTDGWAVGLQLAGLALRKADDPDAFVEHFRGTHSYVADYLADEVLAGIPLEQERFLVRTAPLRKLTGPLCDAALERTGSQALLEKLSRENLFLIPLDSERRWFRYHHLFADLLLRRGGEAEAGERRDFLIRAAEWCEANGDVDAAIEYATQAGDGTLGADLVARHGIGALAAGGGFTVLRWIRLLPDRLVQSSPDHCIIAAWALTLMHVHEPAGVREDGEVERRGTALPPNCSPAHDPIGAYANQALELLAHLPRPFPHVDDVDQHARVLLASADDEAGPEAALAALEEARDRTPPENLALRAVAEIRIGELCCLMGLYDQGILAQDRARAIAEVAGSELLRLSAVTGRALILLLQGELEALEASVTAELQGRTSLRESLGTYMGNLQALQAVAHLESGNLSAAQETLARAWAAWGGAGEEASQAWRSVVRFGRPRPRASHLTVHGVLWGFVTHIRLLFLQGQHAVALQQLDEVESTLPPEVSSVHRVALDSLRVEAWVAAGHRTQLRGWWKGNSPPCTGTVHWDQVARLARARAALAAGEPEATREELAEVFLHERGLALPAAIILDGVAASSLGPESRNEATYRIRQALELTAPHPKEAGSSSLHHTASPRIAPWMEAGPAVVPLIEAAIVEGSASSRVLGHATELLKRIGESEGVETHARDGTASLSQREMAVLRLLAAGRTNQEIASTLFVAVGTVKKHTHNIFGKLGVANRTQAARLAGELGLLD